MSTETFSLRDVYQAQKKISIFVKKTPLVPSVKLQQISGANIFLKLENLQKTGAFKLRGATNKILSLTKLEQSRGVITVSSGNHGRAVAYIAQRLGIPATVVISEPVPKNKRTAIKNLGANLIVGGKDADEAMLFADKLTTELGLTMIHPFDDLQIIAGQGTIGLELFEEQPAIDTVIVPLSGGGLISGIAYTVKSIYPSIKVIGVTMENGAAMVESLKAGKIVDIIETPTIADALAGGLNKDNKYTFPMVQKYVDETILVSDEEIKQGILFCMFEHQVIIEGAAAVGIAALLSKKIQSLGKNIAVMISGANIDPQIIQKIINETHKTY